MLSLHALFISSLFKERIKLLVFFVSPPDLQKTKRAPKAAKVEVGTGTRDASMDEWLQVCGSYIFTEKEIIIITTITRSYNVLILHNILCFSGNGIYPVTIQIKEEELK